MNLSAVLTGLLAAPAALDLANPQWSWIELPASNFVDGRSGWLLSLAAISAGLASAAMAAHIDGHRAGRRLLGVWAGGMVVAGLVPADPPGRWDDQTAANTVHGVAALTAFLVLPVAALLLTAAWRRDPRRRRFRDLLTVTAAVTVVAYAAFITAMVDVMGGPELGVGSHPTVVGLLERVMLWSSIAWPAAAAIATSRVRSLSAVRDLT